MRVAVVSARARSVVSWGILLIGCVGAPWIGACLYLRTSAPFDRVSERSFDRVFVGSSYRDCSIGLLV